MAKLKLGVLFGGIAEEHPVSVKSAREVAKHIDPGKYEPFYIGITKGGAWRLCESPDTPLHDPAAARPAALSPDRTTRGLLVLDDGKYETIGLDVILPVLHGRFGEDGAIQGLLELSGIPYVGCDIRSSALCIDKSLTYLVVGQAGIATPEFRTVTPADTVAPEKFAYPVFVKPAGSGSSFGVTKVERAEDLVSAIAVARQYDAKVLIENAVAGSEVGCAVLGEGTARDGSDLIVGEPDRIALTHGFFRIHQEDAPETGSENSTFIVPADIPEQSRALVQATAKAIYLALGCRGLARVDLFLKDDGSVVLNEVNTLPGMTSYSRYARMMTAAGVPMSEVVDRLVALALSGDHR